jgi:aspartate racemase
MIGIIGGLGVGATVHYYKAIVDAYKQRDLVPQLLIAHADAERVLADVRDGKLIALGAYLAGFANRLAAGGATVGAIAAVAPHICFAELARQSQLPMINMVAHTAQAIAARGLRRVALFGTRFVIETDLYGQLSDVVVVRPKPPEIDLIHHTYLNVVTLGQATEEHRAALRRLAHILIERDGVDAIVLAGTELALVFDAANPDFPAIDCTAVHIDGIMRRVSPSGIR